MIALDTSVVVRLLTADDPDQAMRAAALIDSGPCSISVTVVLETARVLRKTYGLDRMAVAASLMALFDVTNLKVEHRSMVAVALRWSSEGMDVADAMHLAAAGGADAFASFDRRLAAHAAALGATPKVIAPPPPSGT